MRHIELMAMAPLRLFSGDNNYLFDFGSRFNQDLSFLFVLFSHDFSEYFDRP